MGYQDDYVMRTISDLVRAIARLALWKNEINYALPDTEDKYSDTDRIYRKLRDLVDAGEINEAENQLYENLDENDTEHLEMALTFYMYLNQLDDDTLFMANYSREEIVEGINSVSASFGITGFENFVDTTMVWPDNGADYENPRTYRWDHKKHRGLLQDDLKHCSGPLWRI